MTKDDIIIIEKWLARFGIDKNSKPHVISIAKKMIVRDLARKQAPIVFFAFDFSFALLAISIAVILIMAFSMQTINVFSLAVSAMTGSALMLYALFYVVASSIKAEVAEKVEEYFKKNNG